MAFGDKWRKHGAGYWDAMWLRNAGLAIDQTLTGEVLRARSIIEIGCGAGHLAKHFRDAGYRGGYWGCDFSPAATEAARRRVGGGGTIETGRFEDLAAAGLVPRADLVVARSVIQHQAHWLPLVEAAIRQAPRVLLGIIRSIYFKRSGEHEVTDRGNFYDVCISLDAMEREASGAGLVCGFKLTGGRQGPEVLIELARA